MKTNQDDKEQQIICAAIDIFACPGYAASNVPSIAAASGVSVGSIYHYFKNKQAILNAVFQTICDQIMTIIQEDLQTDQPIKKRFNQFFDQSVALVNGNPTALHFIYQNSFNEDLDDTSRKLRRQIIERVTAFIKEGQQQQILVAVEPMTQLALLIGSLSMMANFVWISQDVDQSSVDPKALTELKIQVWNGLSTNRQSH